MATKYVLCPDNTPVNDFSAIYCLKPFKKFSFARVYFCALSLLSFKIEKIILKNLNLKGH